MGEDLRDQEGVVVAEAALERAPQRRQLGAQPAPCQLRKRGRIVAALQSASSISRPETPSTFDATEESLTPASSSTLCSRLASEARARINVLR